MVLYPWMYYACGACLRQAGLLVVDRLPGASLAMLFKTQSAAVYGIDAYLVEVEVDVGSARMQDFNVVGLPDNAVKESRERIKSVAKLRLRISLWPGCDDQFGACRRAQGRLGV